MTTTLATLTTGQHAVIRRVGGEGAFRVRLLELGVVPGTEVVRTGQAPLGDPIAFRIRGATITLRRVDAEGIEVET